MKIPNPLYLPLTITFIATIFVYASLLLPWVENKNVGQILTITHVGGLTYYANVNDFNTYTMMTYIRYINSDIYFQQVEYEEKNDLTKKYNYQDGMLKFIAVLTAFQFIYMIVYMTYIFFDIRRESKVLEKRKSHFENTAWIVYIVLAVISVVPILSAILGGAALSKVGFEDAATQEKFVKSCGSGMILNIFATIAQIISAVLAFVVARFYKPKPEAVYGQF